MSREKQIEEMAREICSEYDCVIPCQSCAYYGYANCRDVKSAEKLYNAGYRKQSVGEWVDSLKGYCQCSNCRTSFETLPTTFLFKLNNRFCRHCGAKMKGGAE